MNTDARLLDRRTFLAAGAVSGAALLASASRQEKTWQKGVSPWPLCLDTATLKPHGDIRDKVKTVAKAGYDGIEPWDGELADYEKKGGSLADLGREIKDLGLIVPNVIGLWDAIPPTREAFEANLKPSRERMRMAAAIGAQNIQVIPQPARAWRDFDPKWAADRYRELLEIGLKEFNLVAAMVFVNFLEGSRRLGQAAQIAIDADHPRARIIPDTFHMHLGGSGFHGLKHLRPGFIAVFSISDAPAKPSAEELDQMGVVKADQQRLFPGDGALPLVQCLKDLKTIGYTGAISLELYNPEYYKMEAVKIAETGLRKTLEVVRKAVG